MSLRDEYKVYHSLKDWGEYNVNFTRVIDSQMPDGCARVLDFQNGHRPVMVMELYIGSVATLCRKRPLPTQSIAIIGKQMVSQKLKEHETTS